MRDHLKEDGVLDPHNSDHIGAMSELQATAVAYGINSEKYRSLLARLEQLKARIMALNKGAPCGGQSSPQQLADRLWARGYALAGEKKTVAAIPFLKDSLAICPNTGRSAYLASLSKSAASSTSGTFDGTYSGQVVYAKILRSNDSKETLKLTIAGSRVSGSTKYTNINSKTGAINLIVETTISGEISGDGTITATSTAKDTHFRDGKMTGQSVGPPGTLHGKVNGDLATGTATFDRSKLMVAQPPATGTWKAARQ